MVSTLLAEAVGLMVQLGESFFGETWKMKQSADWLVWWQLSSAIHRRTTWYTYFLQLREVSFFVHPFHDFQRTKHISPEADPISSARAFMNDVDQGYARCGYRSLKQYWHTKYCTTCTHCWDCIGFVFTSAGSFVTWLSQRSVDRFPWRALVKACMFVAFYCCLTWLLSAVFIDFRKCVR